MITVLMIDDCSVFDQSVLAHLPTTYQIVSMCDATQAQESLICCGYDIMLLNVALDQQGICRWIRSTPRLTLMPIICASCQNDLTMRLNYFNQGVDDFLVVPFDGRELAARIATVLRRSQPRRAHPASLVAAGGKVRLDVQRRMIAVDDNHFFLTQLEYLVLYRLMQVPGHIVSTEELLESVWGYHNGTGDPALVRAQIKNLRRKLSPADQESKWLRTVPGLGYQVAT